MKSKAVPSSDSGDRARTRNIAIVGCGQIADAHLQELSKISGVTTVATCDAHLDLAMQAAKRFAVPRYYDDVSTMLRVERPDIVHIATPAQTHMPLARHCMEAGAHVYIEKPLALDAAEVREILSASQSLGRKVCVGHDQLYDPAWLALKGAFAISLPMPLTAPVHDPKALLPWIVNLLPEGPTPLRALQGAPKAQTAREFRELSAHPSVGNRGVELGTQVGS